MELSILVGKDFVWGYTSFVALVFGGALVWFLILVSRLNADIRSAQDAVSGGSSAPWNNRKPSELRHDLATRWADTAAQVERIGGLSHSWLEFTECLIVPSPEDRSVGSVIRNTRDPSVYFTRASVISPQLNLRFFESVPGLLTGFGILGTFVGLAAGIALAQGGFSGQESINIQEMMKDLSKLLGGASLAFVTSIAGLSTSILFLLVERWGVNRIDRALNQWNSLLERALERTTPEKVAVEQLEEAKQQTAAFKTLATDIAMSIRTQLDESVAARLAPALERIVAATEGLRDQQASASEEMLQAVVDQFGKTMAGAAGEQMEAMSTTLAGLDGMLRDSITALRQQEETSVNGLKDLSSEVVQTLRTGSSEIRQGFQEMVSELVSSTDSTMAGMLERLDEVAQSAADSTKEQSRALGEMISAELVNVGNALRQVTGEMSAELGRAGASASTHLSESAEGLAAQLATLTKAIDEARDLTANLASTSRTVTAAAEGVSQVLERLNEVAPTITRSSSVIASASSTIEAVGREIGEFGRTTTDAASKLGATIADLETNWSRYVSRFDGADEALAGVVREMEQGLNSFTDKVREFNRGVDKEFSQALNLLTGAIEELDATLDERVS